MKKFLVVLTILTAFSLTSCRVTKTISLVQAKSISNMHESDFLKSKAEKINFLVLSEEQQKQLIRIWQAEKETLGNAHEKKDKDIAPIILKSEMTFRNVLTKEQLETYRETNKNLYTSGYLNDKQLEELKRIYKL